MINRRFWYLVTLTIILYVTSAQGYTSEDCIFCHKKGSKASKLTISVDGFNSSIHGGEISCIDCHQGADDDNHMKMKGSGNVDCQTCHEQDAKHGAGTETPCYQCHSRHAIYKTNDIRSTVNDKNLKKTCMQCHPKQCKENDGLKFLPSIYVASHPKQNFATDYDKDQCMGCHQGQAAHGEEEPINDQKCYNCHLPLRKYNALMGYVHTSVDLKEQPVTYIAVWVYAATFILLLCSVGIFVIKRKRK